MLLSAIWQKQRNSLRQRPESFFIQRLHILGSHHQDINSKQREPLRDSKMNIEVWI